jgi:hypothetical protein
MDKASFDGDLRIEYEFTRLDTTVRFVNIIYIQATGSGEDGFGHDISEWSDYRRVPSMSHYFRNMHTYHISYAAFGTQNNDPDEDYVRARRYMHHLVAFEIPIWSRIMPKQDYSKQAFPTK